MQLVIVESPAKARTINKYLGPGYTVLASFGHVRDLPSKDGSVLPDQDFEMIWEVDSESKKHVRAIADSLAHSDRLILATDPDREGEAISWHLLKVLEEKKPLKIPVERVVFNAITERSVKEAMAHPRAIDQELVDAYLARRALDYLVGFTLSPVLWRKLPGARSAGRVQSVALRLICDRELEIEAFRAQEYWTVEAELATQAGELFAARLVELKGRKLEKFDLPNEAAAKSAADAIRARPLTVTLLETKPARRHPPPPFTTSTLTQEASRKMGFTAKRTMQIAQRLYEGVEVGGETAGLITYMRTDGVDITPEAITEIRGAIKSSFGANYLPDAPRVYKVKAKNAQEAHEAIRPTDASRSPDRVKRFLDGDQFRLYELIWKRTLASQMESARLERTTVHLASADGEVGLRATGTVTLFDGFLTLYQEGRDDSADGEDGSKLPRLALGDQPATKSVVPSQHFTEPPPRYGEASLIKRLEELGIGRPSTYASIISVLQDRGYVVKEQNRFIPEDKGRLVTAFLESYFKRYVEYDFTADLEEKLDRVSNGEVSWKDLLRDFWREFTAAIEGTAGLRVSDVLEEINKLLAPHIFPPKEDGSDPRLCTNCAGGRLSLKTGKFGAFIGCSNYPLCRYTRQLGASGEGSGADQEPQVLGTHPESGLPVSLRKGRFGPYIQLGEAAGEEKPKRAGLPKDAPAETTFEYALALLRLPRIVGEHPETHQPIEANIGRYGPYLRHDGKYASLDASEEVFTVGLNRAVALIAERAGKGNRRTPEPLRGLGAHPDDGKPINVMKGRYGPYVAWNKIYATIPRDSSPETITLDAAIALLAERAAKGGKGKKKPAKTNGAPKKAAAKKSAKAKPANSLAEKKPAKRKPAKAKPVKTEL
jgi:DNA topoisomerase-1